MASKSSTYQAVIALGAKLDKTFGPTMKAAQKGIATVGKGVALAGKVAAVGIGAAAAGMVGATKMAADLQQQMSNVGTLLDGDVNARLAELQKKVIAVSNTTGVATEDLTDGLYQVVSAFGDSAEATKQLEIASKAARAGNASTTDSINLLSAVTKGYNDTSAEAMQKAADLAFQTVKLGQTDFPELAASIGKVIPLANTMKASQEDLFGALATLTGVTGGAAEVSTQLRGVFQGFLQPTKQMAEAIKQLGYTDGQAMMDSLGLQGTLEALKGTVGGNELAFANLFGSVEAKNAVLAMTGAQAENLTEKTKAMYESTGIANQVFSAQTDNLNTVIANMKNLGKNALTTFGGIILPRAHELAVKIMPTVQSLFEQLPGILDGLAPVAENVFGFISSTITSFTENGLPLLKDGISFITGSVLPALGEGFTFLTADVLPALMPVLSAIKKAFSGIFSGISAGDAKSTIMQVITTLVNIAVPAIGLLGTVVRTVMGVIQKIAPVVAPIISQISVLAGKFLEMANAVLPVLGVVLSAVFGSLLEAARPVIDGVLTALGGLMDFITGVFTLNFDQAIGGIGDMFKGVFGALVGYVKAPLNTIIGMVNKVFAGIGNIQIPDWVPGIGGKSFSLPQIPMLYTGTRNWSGGAAVVGDRGPELVDLPRGANVYSNKETRSILSTPQDFGGSVETYKIEIPVTIQGHITQKQADQAAAMTERALEAMLERIMEKRRRKAFAN